MRSEMDAFWEQFDELTPIDQKLLADGTATAKGMARVRALDDELEERRKHDKDLARINASGPVRAEIVKMDSRDSWGRASRTRLVVLRCTVGLGPLANDGDRT
jgi:hypothetical protein